jgi:hypothetical protein
MRPISNERPRVARWRRFYRLEPRRGSGSPLRFAEL